jgi:thymidylate synthase
MLDFQLAIAASGLMIVNPFGTVAVCSLWTPPGYLLEKIREKAGELLGEGSPIAVVGGLYGAGLKIMLRNLYHNPQVDTVILCGKDFSGAGEHLRKFFRGEYERTGKKKLYAFESGEERELETIVIKGRKTVYMTDELLLPEYFKWVPKITELSTDKDGLREEKLKHFLSGYSPSPPLKASDRPEPIPLPHLVSDVFPADSFAQVIVSDGILDGWSRLLWRLYRFGVPVSFRKGKERRELNNMKVVIKQPDVFDKEIAFSSPYNLSQEYIDSYQDELLKKEITLDGLPYTYGNRIRVHFEKDLLDMAARNLSGESDSRRAYIALWDNTTDMEAPDSPCLVSLFFRKIESKVHLTATFRSHNATHAWPLNCFGLLKLMEYAVNTANSSPDKKDPNTLTIGSLTVLSLSMTLNTEDLDQVKDIIDREESSPYRMAEDPNGYFRLTLDRENHEIVVEHYNHADELLTEYRGKNTSDLSKKLYKAMAISDIGHAMYLGSQLERAWYALEKGLEYIQDKTKLV